MPSPIPDRFRLEMRLGRDGDVEEWLATDVSLDRPVLVRALGPETSTHRRQQFVHTIGAVAGVSHPHLTKVFMVELVDGGAYAVLEWTGASTVADLIAADRTIDLAEFLPNATGLAGALASLHEHGLAHGSIDLSSISYSVAHPAKLGGFGRIPRTDRAGDVQDLASVLETALTGRPHGGPAPSESIDGLSPAIDRILVSAQVGQLDAEKLEKAFSSAPTPRAPAPEARAGSRRLLYAALGLIALAAGLIALGLFFSGGSTEPVLPTRPTTTVTTVATTTTSVPAGPVRALSALLFDPRGDSPDDPSVRLLIDNDPETFWVSEVLGAPLGQERPEFGVMITVEGRAGGVELVGMTPGTEFEMRWAPTPNPDPDRWETLARARAIPGNTSLALAPRSDGHWVVWFTSIPEAIGGGYRTSLGEVRFRP
jgi:hypothetical protein